MALASCAARAVSAPAWAAAGPGASPGPRAAMRTSVGSQPGLATGYTGAGAASAVPVGAGGPSEARRRWPGGTGGPSASEAAASRSSSIVSIGAEDERLIDARAVGSPASMEGAAGS